MDGKPAAKLTKNRRREGGDIYTERDIQEEGWCSRVDSPPLLLLLLLLLPIIEPLLAAIGMTLLLLLWTVDFRTKNDRGIFDFD